LILRRFGSEVQQPDYWIREYKKTTSPSPSDKLKAVIKNLHSNEIVLQIHPQQASATRWLSSKTRRLALAGLTGPRRSQISMCIIP